MSLTRRQLGLRLGLLVLLAVGAGGLRMLVGGGGLAWPESGSLGLLELGSLERVSAELVSRARSHSRETVRQM